MLIGIVVLILTAITVAFPEDACSRCDPPTLDRKTLAAGPAETLREYQIRVQAIGRQAQIADSYRPQSGVFLSVGFVFLVLAGSIGAGRLQTENDLKEDKLRLTGQRKKLVSAMAMAGVAVPDDIADDIAADEAGEASGASSADGLDPDDPR